MEFISGQVGTTFITLLCKQGDEGTEGCPCGDGSPAAGRGAGPGMGVGRPWRELERKERGRGCALLPEAISK